MANSISIGDAILQGRELSERAFMSLKSVPSGEPDSVFQLQRDAMLQFAYDIGTATHNLRAFDAAQKSH